MSRFGSVSLVLFLAVSQNGFASKRPSPVEGAMQGCSRPAPEHRSPVAALEKAEKKGYRFSEQRLLTQRKGKINLNGIEFAVKKIPNGSSIDSLRREFWSDGFLILEFPDTRDSGGNMVSHMQLWAVAIDGKPRDFAADSCGADETTVIVNHFNGLVCDEPPGIV